MKKMINKISKNMKVYHSTGVDETEIINAEIDLGVTFSDEYKEYLREYGAISFGSHEFTGLNVDNYTNVVNITKQEREMADKFPENCIVIENLGIEGILILQDNKGYIYQYSKAIGLSKIFDSLSDYFLSCVE